MTVDADISRLDSSTNGIDCTVEGQRKDINTIFLKLRIADTTGKVHNIHFPFDIEADTSISVAAEMVAELDLTDQDVTTIADMIDTEIQVHFPDWAPGALDDDHDDETTSRKEDSEAEDENNALPNDSCSSGNLVLERLPSGRKYWSGSPKGSSNNSPSRQTLGFNSHDNNDVLAEGNEKEGTFHVHGERDDEVGNSRQSIIGFKSLIDYGPESHMVDQNLIEVSTSSLSNENQTEVLLSNGTTKIPENESEASVFVIRRLEELLVEQQNELDDLRKKHDLAIANTLRGLPLELQSRAFTACQKKFLDCRMQTKNKEVAWKQH